MNILKIIIGIVFLTSLTSCKNFEEYQSDPNRTTKGNPGLLLTNIQVNTLRPQVSLSAALASRQMVYTDGSDNNQYYGWQRSDFGNYDILRQIVKMEKEALLIENTNYLAVGKLFRAYIFLNLTKIFGDIPYSEALKGEDGVFTPIYDSQEDIYISILNDLKIANDMLNNQKGAINGDAIYDGDTEKWKKTINSLSLRVLISLSKKEGNTKINVVHRFKEIVENPSRYPIFTSNEDNLALPFYNIKDNEYPYFNSNVIQTAYYFDESFVNMLKDFKDPRLFTFADRESNGIALAEDDFDAYGGLGGSDLLSDNTSRLAAGEGSSIDKRYYNNAENEPGIALGYAEIEFTLAEAAARGWISSNPVKHYNNGIKASLKFYNIEQSLIDSYLKGKRVQYESQRGIEMIITQKYISFFMNSGLEPFFNQRRTGFPKFSTNGKGILNNGIIPKRWMYPESEITYNIKNLQTAIKRQYPDGDTVNGEIWLLKEE